MQAIMQEAIVVGIAVASGISALGCFVGSIANNGKKAFTYFVGCALLAGLSGGSVTDAVKLDSAPQQAPQQAIIQQTQTPNNG